MANHNKKTKKTKYYAIFSANNHSTYPSEPYAYTNKAEAIKSIKKIVRGYHFWQPFNRSSYIVWNSTGVIIASGCINDLGWWSVDKDAIGENINQY